ncbi:xanthine dehydrogenase family protein molybdopterin-binding subunit [Thalassomonas actiniarum]|uniref:Xanthine dehydrogenase family protein molybdopterin-binding subunit n=1 Tax=Thalassomonas actiniarum TaxID=485447 RepID=A0AAF0C4H1_9GAMM|nr:molybdopterin cofactor-binding domain-containing protein [Thalassomonas actiniarum]WDD99819.1 xanthine dehydrogenase family protein molybdopterin-binding subunit [Thalassomonas actiniarum]
MDISRRQFLSLSASAGAMLMTISMPSLGQRIKKAPDRAQDNWSVYLHIKPDNSIVIESPVQEQGQHMKTTGAMMIAEELDADWSLVSCIAAKTYLKKTENGIGYRYADMNTGGSHAVRRNWQILREAGASARQLLISAAAKAWRCSESELSTGKSFVYRKSTGQKLPYGKLAATASTLELPDKKLTFKDRSQYTIFGQDITTVDIDEIVTGQPLFGLDMKMPDMVYAVIERCPYFHGEIKSYNDKKALALPGVIKTVKIDKVIGEDGIKEIAAGIGVLAENYWAAIQGRKALEIEWQQGPWSEESSDSLMADFEKFCMGEEEGRTLLNTGDLKQGFDDSIQTFDQCYQVPLLAHACMEPFNAIAHITDKKGGGKQAKIITGHQFPNRVASSAAQYAGIDPLDVEVIPTRMGGGFGRRYYNDFVIEATLLAKETPRPVKLVWTREDEMTQDYFGQSTFTRLKAGIDKQGELIAWHHRQGQIDGSMREQCFPYQLIENFRVDSYQQRAGTPTGAWRGPGHFQFAFATESMIDEVAHAVGQDPLAYRLALMGPAKEYPYRGYGATVIDSGRMAKCYQQAADLAKWQQKRPQGVGLGIASHFTFGSYAAFVVEVDSRGDGPMKISGIWGSIDCGLPLNPNHIRNQMEGGFIDGLNAAMFNDAKVSGGQVVNSNFHQQPWIRMADTPALFEVGIIENDHPPTGVGEPPTAPAAAALANAIFAATGKRQRKLPISMEV